jgi:Lactonase, 7-bladed beta-propeller
MISRNNFLPTLLLVIAAVTLVNCAPAVPCNIAGNGGGGSTARLRRDTTTNICGNGGGGGTPTCSSTLKPVQVMFSVDVTGAVLEYGLDATSGMLTLLCNTATAAVGPIAVSNNAFLYVLDTSVTPAQVFGFTIAHGNSGALTAIPGSPFPLSEAITGNATLVADSFNRFMYVTNNAGNDVHVLVIGQNGALSEAANSPFVVSRPDHIAAEQSLAYIPDSTDGDIFIFSLDNNGQLVPTVASPLVIGTGNNSPHFALADGPFLITANQASLSTFAIDLVPADGGALTPVPGSPYSSSLAGDSQVAPLTFALDITGKNLYVTPEGAEGNIPGFQSDNIIGFAFDPIGGGLTPLPNSPFASTSTLDILANTTLPLLYVVTSNTTSVLFDVVPIGTNGNLTIPATGLAVTAVIDPVIANVN